MKYSNFILIVLGIVLINCSEEIPKRILIPDSNDIENTGHILYTANSGLDSISVYVLNPASGNLEFHSETAAGAGSKPRALVVNPSKGFLFSANYGTDEVSTFAIDPVTGALTFVANLRVHNKPSAITVNPAGTFLFVSFEGTKTTATYSINSTTGVLAEISSLSYGASAIPTSVAIHSSGVFAIATTDDFLQPYAIDSTGTLSAVSSNEPVSGRDIKFSPNDNQVAVADSVQGRIYTWSVDSTNGTPLSNPRINTTSSTSGPNAILWDKTGAFLFSANGAENRVEAFSVAGTGILTTLGTTFINNNCQPKSLALDFDGRYLYTACSTSIGVVKVYSINTNGTLIQVGINQRSGSSILGMAAVKLF